MNEQVKQLMIKHGLHKYITEDCQNRMEMLAELLEKEYFSAGYTAGHSDGIMETVKECARLCETRYTQHKDLSPQSAEAMECSMAILKHFGVEE